MFLSRSYDYHGHWDKATGHVSPMYEHPDDTYDYFNTVTITILLLYINEYYYSNMNWFCNGNKRNRTLYGNHLTKDGFSLRYIHARN